MTGRARIAIALAVFVMAAPPHARAADAALHGIVIDRALDAEPLPADLPRIVPTIVRLTIEDGAFAGPSADATIARLQSVLDVYQSRHTTVLVALGRVPNADSDVEAWRQFIRAVATRGRGAVSGYQIGSVQGGAAPDVNRYVYLLKLAAVQIRSIDSSALILQGGVPAGEAEWEGRVLAGGAAPYVDLVAVGGPASEEDESFRSAVDRIGDCAWDQSR